MYWGSFLDSSGRAALSAARIVSGPVAFIALSHALRAASFPTFRGYSFQKPSKW